MQLGVFVLETLPKTTFNHYKTSKYATIFFAVISGIVIYCIITSNSCSHTLFIAKQLKKSTSFVSHGLALYVKEGLPFGWDLSLENSENSYLHTMTYAFN